MENYNQSNTDKSGSMFTVKNVMRVLSVLCIIFVFCPSFLVSCSGQNVNVSVMTAVGGVSVYGEKVVDPHPIMLICFLIPIAILVLLFIKKFTDNKTALIILICSAVDFIVWLIFRSSVKKIAEQNYCTFKTTAWYVFNIISLILIILLSVMVVIKKMEMDADLVSIFSGGGTQKALNQMSSAVTQMSSAVSQMAGNAASNINNKNKKIDAIGYCAKCGSPIEYGCKFCTSCGTAVPENMLAEAEAAKKAAEEEAARRAREEERKAAEEKAKIAEEEKNQAPDNLRGSLLNAENVIYCPQCGTKLDADAMFCISCGAKVE